MPIDITGIKAYLYAGVAAVFLALSVVVVIQHETIRADKAELKTQKTELSVSNASVKDLTNTLEGVYKQLADAQAADAKKQAEIKSALDKITQDDKSLTDLQKSLDNRKSTSNCPVPKDLKNAWNSL